MNRKFTPPTWLGPLLTIIGLVLCGPDNLLTLATGTVIALTGIALMLYWVVTH